MDYIPVEILEEIFSYLNLKDLGSCSKVCVAWHEIINCNALWSRLSALEDLNRKEYLNNYQSLVDNPLRSYRPIPSCSQRLSQDCHWKSHFKHYKFLEESWRDGKCTNIQTGARVNYYKDGIIVNSSTSSIEIIEVYDFKNKHRVPVLYPDSRVDEVFVHNELVFYIQNSYVICLKKNNDTYEIFYTIKVKNDSCSHKINMVEEVTPKVTANTTNQYLILQDNKRPCKLFIYFLLTGAFDKEIDVISEKTSCITTHCTTIYCDKIYLSYSLNKNHFIAVFDPSESLLQRSFETDTPASELTMSKHFICAKLLAAANLKNCEVHVWPHRTHEEKYTFFADKHLPIILTYDERIIFSDDTTIYVHSLVSSPNETYQLEPQGKIVDMVPIFKHLMVVNNSNSLQLWNWRRAHKLQILVREKVVSMWVDEKSIVLNKFEEQFNGHILAFW